MEIYKLMESAVMKGSSPETLITQEILSQILKEMPTGILILNDDWPLVFANDTAIFGLNIHLEELEGIRCMDWLIGRNSKLSLTLLRIFLNIFWPSPVKNRRIRISFNQDSYLVFLVLLKNICIASLEYRVVLLRETTIEHRDAMRAVKLHKSFRRDLKMAKIIQKIINNSVLDQVLTKDYIFHFHSKFMPSNDLSGDLINIHQIHRRYVSFFW